MRRPRDSRLGRERVRIGRRRTFSRDAFFPSNAFHAEQALEYIATPEGEPEARLTREAKVSLKRLERR
jgi:hypothetical protein